jgi:hypothetical protein
MSCGCTPSVIQIPVATTCSEAQAQSANGPCESFRGKFYDKSIEPFVFPKSGNIGSLMVCEASLWSKHQFVGIAIGNSKYAFLRIVETGQNALKVLNGFVKDDASKKIYGNPEAGVVIPEGAVLFPCPPIGGADQLQLEFMALLEQYGVDGVIKILRESDQVSFEATEELDTDPDYKAAYLFGGSWLSDKLQKIKRIWTGQGGRTLCFPEVATTTEANVTVDDVSIPKRFAYFDEKDCLKKGAPVKCFVHDRRSNVIVLQNLYSGHTTELTYTWAALNAPAACGGRTVIAEIEILIQIGATGGLDTILDGYIDGVLQNRAQATVNGLTYTSRRVMVSVNPAGTIKVKGVINLGSPSSASVTFILVQYHV